MQQRTAVNQLGQSPIPITSGVLQRKCACGNHTIAGVDALEWEKFSRQMASKGATSSEVEKLLGRPKDHYGWFPMETWEYPLGEITFCNGIIVANEEEWQIPPLNAKPDAFK